jgi:hypothetical protein
MDWLFNALPGGPESLDGLCGAPDLPGEAPALREGRLEGGGGCRFCGGDDFEVLEADRPARRVRFRLNLGEGAPEMEKTYTLTKNCIILDYRLRNPGEKPLSFILVPSLDLSFPGDGERVLRINTVREGLRETVKPGEGLTVRDITALAFKDVKNETLISLDSTLSFDARIVPVRAGEREEYQSTCVLPILPLTLPPAGTAPPGAGEEARPAEADPSVREIQFILKISS